MSDAGKLLNGVRGRLILWGPVTERRDFEDFAIHVGGRSLCACLLAFDCANVHVLRAYSTSRIGPQDLVDLQVQILEGQSVASMPYQEADWSEITPGEYQGEMGSVGGHNLVEEMGHHIGQYCVLVVSTDPIDVTDLAEAD